MLRSKSTGNSKIPPKQPGRRNTSPDYVNITRASEEDDVFYVNVGPKKDKPAPEKLKKSAFGFEKYDDIDSSNYYEVGAGSQGNGSGISLNGNSSPYMNQHRGSHTPRGCRSYENIGGGGMLTPPCKPKMNYVQLNLPGSSLGSPKSRTSSTGSSFAHSPISVSPTKKSSSSDYVRIDSDATGAIHRSISEHRQPEGKRKKKTLKTST